MTREAIGYDPRARRRERDVECRVGLGQVQCSDQHGVDVFTDTDDSVGGAVGAVGAEGRIVESNIKLCAVAADDVGRELHYVAGLDNSSTLGKYGGLVSNRCY